MNDERRTCVSAEWEENINNLIMTNKTNYIINYNTKGNFEEQNKCIATKYKINSKI